MKKTPQKEKAFFGPEGVNSSGLFLYSQKFHK